MGRLLGERDAYAVRVEEVLDALAALARRRRGERGSAPARPRAALDPGGPGAWHPGGALGGRPLDRRARLPRLRGHHRTARLGPPRRGAEHARGGGVRGGGAPGRGDGRELALPGHQRGRGRGFEIPSPRLLCPRLEDPTPPVARHPRPPLAQRPSSVPALRLLRDAAGLGVRRLPVLPHRPRRLEGRAGRPLRRLDRLDREVPLVAAGGPLCVPLARAAAELGRRDADRPGRHLRGAGRLRLAHHRREAACRHGPDHRRGPRLPGGLLLGHPGHRARCLRGRAASPGGAGARLRAAHLLVPDRYAGGGRPLVSLSDYLPWPVLFLGVAALFAAFVLVTLASPEPERPTAAPRTLGSAVVEPLRHYFLPPGRRRRRVVPRVLQVRGQHGRHDGELLPQGPLLHQRRGRRRHQVHRDRRHHDRLARWAQPS